MRFWVAELSLTPKLNHSLDFLCSDRLQFSHRFYFVWVCAGFKFRLIDMLIQVLTVPRARLDIRRTNFDWSRQGRRHLPEADKEIWDMIALESMKIAMGGTEGSQLTGGKRICPDGQSNGFLMSRVWNAVEIYSWASLFLLFLFVYQIPIYQYIVAKLDPSIGQNALSPYFVDTTSDFPSLHSGDWAGNKTTTKLSIPQRCSHNSTESSHGINLHRWNPWFVS